MHNFNRTRNLALCWHIGFHTPGTYWHAPCIHFRTPCQSFQYALTQKPTSVPGCWFLSESSCFSRIYTMITRVLCSLCQFECVHLDCVDVLGYCICTHRSARSCAHHSASRVVHLLCLCGQIWKSNCGFLLPWNCGALPAGEVERAWSHLQGCVLVVWSVVCFCVAPVSVGGRRTVAQCYTAYGRGGASRERPVCCKRCVAKCMAFCMGLVTLRYMYFTCMNQHHYRPMLLLLDFFGQG